VPHPVHGSSSTKGEITMKRQIASGMGLLIVALIASAAHTNHQTRAG
jgi:hypothetical protein